MIALSIVLAMLGIVTLRRRFANRRS
jgi:hypothetical protein